MIKFLGLLFLIAALPQALPAGPNQPQIEILKFSWRKLPQSKSPHDKQAEEKRNELIDASIRAELQQDYPDSARLKSLEAMKTQTPDQPKNKAYEYKLRLRNTGSLQIVSLKWAYVFKDATSGNELLRHSFEARVKVLPDRQKEIVLFTDAAPPRVVDANAIKQGSRGWDEAVVIEAVEYADGSRWARE